ncbi:MAG: hypothetical protein IT292_05445 [Deltaproteobacteria bacterium]|nr:hypothetical protein [Deltaproteobacteria bacterium]
MINRFIRMSFLVIVMLVYSACDEVGLYEYLKDYGVLVKGKDITLADVRYFLNSEPQYTTVTNAEDAALIDDTTIVETCTDLKITTPRGLSCLHCNQDGARAQAQAIASILHRSCLKNIAINYLIDGTFSFDAEILYDHITKLTDGDRRLFVYFYLTNGATQRLWRKTPIDALGTKISPDDFRDRILYDTELQGRYRKIVRRLIPFIRYANARGAVVSLIPGLEDNLSNRAFQKLYSLALKELPTDVHVGFGRNACPSCSSGNEEYVPRGLFTEQHTDSRYFQARDGVVTNDGREYSSPIMEVGNARVTLEALKAVRNAATKTNNTFILWSARRQGITQNSESMLVHPRNRQYAVPTLEERRELIDFLRGDLNY